MDKIFQLNDGEFTLNKSYWINSTRIETITKEHTHDYVELVYTFSGTGVHIIDGERYNVKKGDLIFINFGCIHSIEPDGQLKYVDIMLKPDFIDQRLKNSNDAFSLLATGSFKEFESLVNKSSKIIHFFAHEREDFEHLIEWTIREQEENLTAKNFMIRSILNMILIKVFRKMKVNLTEEFTIDADMLKFIEENCGKQISLSEIAKNVNYTPSYISFLFKSYSGMSFTEYIKSCRIKKAKKLLTETNHSIESIIGECGYSNRTRFFNHFRKETGLTPLQYRKQITLKK